MHKMAALCSQNKPKNLHNTCDKFHISKFHTFRHFSKFHNSTLKIPQKMHISKFHI